MRAITTCVSGLLLSAVLLLPSIHAAELQPFFTFKASSVNSLIAVAEKIGTMADFANSNEFKEFIKTVKEVQGFNLDGIIGFAAAVSDDGDLCPILLLPITDLWKIDVPSQPGILDPIIPFLTKRGAERTDMNFPIGTYVALQKQGYLVIVSEDVVEQVPADARKLFADLEKYTLGMKLDLEKVKFETLESQLFGPMIFMAMMAVPEVGEQIEQAVDAGRELSKEFAVLSGGIAFNPQTADVELSGMMVPRKGSDFAKSLAGYKPQPTIFGGFRGTPGNVIVSFGDSATQVPISEEKLNTFTEPLDAVFSGFLDQIEMEDETGETAELAKKVIDSVQKIIVAESKRGTSDTALSLNTDGTLLLASDTGSLAEIQKLISLLVEFAAQRVRPIAITFGIDINASVKQDYVTVEGFKVSSFKFPMDKLVPLIPNPNTAKGFSGLSPGVFWAVKDAGGKQAVAVAAGLDFAKAESAFKSALEKTKTPAPVQKPMGTLSVQGLGKFLQQTVYPVAEKTGDDMPVEYLAQMKKVFDILATAGNDATVTLNADVKPDKIEGGYRISGKAIQAVIAAVKAVIPEGLNRPAMQDF